MKPSPSSLMPFGLLKRAVSPTPAAKLFSFLPATVVTGSFACLLATVVTWPCGTRPLILPQAVVAPVAHEHTAATLLRQLPDAMEARLVAFALCDARLRRVSSERMQEERRLGVQEELTALARSDAPDFPSGQPDRRDAHLDR